MAPLLSICIPAYKSGDRLSATVESALNQSIGDVEIIISNDGGFACAALDQVRRHPRVTVFDQPTRLGWVENSNFVLSRARGRYFMILPHDDQIAPDYASECIGLLERSPAAFAACSDIRYGEDGLIGFEPIRGGRTDRIANVLQNHLNAVSYRAIMRRDPRRWAGLRLLHNTPADYLVDTIWILQQAVQGEILRVDAPLYHKYYGPETAHAAWPNLPAADIVAGWLNHCDTMERIALRFAPGDARIRALAQARRDPDTLAPGGFVSAAFNAQAADEGAGRGALRQPRRL